MHITHNRNTPLHSRHQPTNLPTTAAMDAKHEASACDVENADAVTKKGVSSSSSTRQSTATADDTSPNNPRNGIDANLLSTKSKRSLSWYNQMGCLSRKSQKGFDVDVLLCDSSSLEGTVLGYGDGQLYPLDEPDCDLDILAEGRYFVALSMLIYMYSRLRENSILGYTKIDFDEVDVNKKEDDGMSKLHYLHNTRSVGFIVRVVIDELEEDQMGDEYRHQDIFGGNDEYNKNMMKQFHTWVEDSRAKQLDDETERTIKVLKSKAAVNRWMRVIIAVRFVCILQKHVTRTNDTTNNTNLQIQTSIKYNGSDISTRASTISSSTSCEPRFFRSGSILSNLIESGTEVVWCSDRHPNDVVYCICCNRQSKEVTVVFRGTKNSHNWFQNLKVAMKSYPNPLPITDEYPGREETFGLHTGFALYLMRRRRDIEMTKIEEILNKAESIGKELGDDYKLCITGKILL